MKRITSEEMRYKVPKVKNRFIAAHAKFIIACALFAVISIILFASFAYIAESRKLEPKRAFVFTCDVQDIDACNKVADKFTQTAEIYFAKYDEQFAYNNEKCSFDFSCVCNTEFKIEIDENTALVLFKNNRSSYYDYTFEKLELSNGALSAEQVEQIVREILTK